MNEQQGNRKKRFLPYTIPIGAGLGVGLGLLLANVVDHPGFFAVGIGIGLSIGTAIGLGMDLR